MDVPRLESEQGWEKSSQKNPFLEMLWQQFLITLVVGSAWFFADRISGGEEQYWPAATLIYVLLTSINIVPKLNEILSNKSDN